jgi:hypothetical protein
MRENKEELGDKRGEEKKKGDLVEREISSNANFSIYLLH